MRVLFGVTVVCFALMWLFVLPVFNTQNYLIAGILILVGVFATGGGMTSLQPRHLSGWYILLCIPGVIGLLMVPFPFNIGFILMLVSVVFVLLKWWYPFSYSWGVVAAGLFVSGGMLVLQALVYQGYVMVVALGHRVDALSPIISFILNILGVSAAVNQGMVFVQTASAVVPISTTWEKLGLMPWVFSIVGFVVLAVVLYRRKWWRPVIGYLGLSVVYLIVRYVILVQVFLATDEVSLFWDAPAALVSWMPLIVVVSVVFRRYRNALAVDPFRGVWMGRRQVLVGMLVFICVGAAVGAVGYHDPGGLKEGRVLIDEWHSDWEDSVRSLDTEWFGLLSTYNYYSWAEWINATYRVERNLDHLLSEDLLEEVDVLILKCPTLSYSLEEIGAVTQFVEGGGGLWLIGDHTDVFGMNTYLNQLARVFGIRFRTDATYALGSGNMTRFARPAWFAHPILAQVSEVGFMTSCTLEAPWDSEKVIFDGGMIAEPGTYATENFFRESIESAEAEFGLFLQMTAVKYGKGRVVAFSDSTVFSSFSVCSDGYQDLTLGTLNYLNRENTVPQPNLLVWIIVVFFALLVLIAGWSQSKQQMMISILVAGVMALGVMTLVVSNLNETGYAMPELRLDIDRVWFDVGHTTSMVDLTPRVSLFEEADNFGTLYVWAQRVGLTPGMVTAIDESLFDARLLVVVNPSVSFSDAELSRVQQFVNQGGSLLVFDSIQNDDSTANEVVGGFGLWFYVDTKPTAVLENRSDNASSIGASVIPVLQISGGEVIGTGLDNRSYIRGVEVVNGSTGMVGRVVAVVDAYAFSNKVLGGPLTEPDADQQSLYDTIFYVYQYVVDK